MRARVWISGGLLVSCSPWGSPAIALALGLAYGLAGRRDERRLGAIAGAHTPTTQASTTSVSTTATPAMLMRGRSDRAQLTEAAARRWTTWLLQGAVVLLGFGFDLRVVLLAGQRGLVYTAAGIAGALLLGHLLARLLRVAPTPALLIGVGTAICGGSAIAAVGPAIEADDEDLSMALGTVFILNAAALFLFPLIGAWLALSERQFGLWAALAIHDTSSVVGAGLRYGPIALATATTVKLARALWIVPVALGAAGWRRRMQIDASTGDGGRGSAARRQPGATRRAPFPWFVFGFLGAAAIAQVSPTGEPAYRWLARAGTLGFSGALFLAGTQVTRGMLGRVGWRALALGLLLWTAVAGVSLWCVGTGLIALP